MRIWRKLRERWSEGALADEMRSHREMIEERLRAEGVPADEARARASREFGNLASAIEDAASATIVVDCGPERTT